MKDSKVKIILKKELTEDSFKGAIDVTGLGLDDAGVEKLFAISKEEGLAEVEEMKEYYKMFGERLPKELKEELLNELEARYNNM